MSQRTLHAALLAALLLAPRLALTETWDPAEVAEAEKLRVEEAARAAAYRKRVARGDVRAAQAPMPRDAPQSPESAGEPLRDAADLVDLLERWLGGGRAAGPPRDERREEPRHRERERRGGGADPWWEEEDLRTRGAR